MSIKKNKNQLIISVIVGIIIFAVSYQFVIKQQEEIARLKKGEGVSQESLVSTNYVVAKIELKKGQKIKEEDLEIKKFPIKITSAFVDTKTIVGLTVTKDIKLGNPLLKEAFNSSDFEENGGVNPRSGYRALPLKCASKDYITLLKDGDYIDIYTSNDSFKIKNAKLLKIPDGTGKDNTIIVEVKSDDIQYLSQSMTDGKTKLIPVKINKIDRGEYDFSYDPFKVASSYDYSSDKDLQYVADTIPDDPNAGEYSASYVHQKGTISRKTIKSEKTISTKSQTNVSGTVEVIEGNSRKLVDFNE